MKNPFVYFLLFLFLPMVSVMSQSSKTEVLVISTLHGAHEVNPNYSYADLFSFIEAFNPDVLGVEIRAEDLTRPAAYLKQNYPYEMYICREKYPSTLVVGFDWLGDDLAGRAIPERYWKEQSPIKKLQQELSADSVMREKLAVLDVLSEEKKALALRASLTSLNDGRYDLINRVYYAQLNVLLKNTPYEALSTFYATRDEMIARQILALIKSHPGKRMLFLVGADHRAYVVQEITKTFGDTLMLNPSG